jgi:hypothetical protein
MLMDSGILPAGCMDRDFAREMKPGAHVKLRLKLGMEARKRTVTLGSAARLKSVGKLSGEQGSLDVQGSCCLLEPLRSVNETGSHSWNITKDSSTPSGRCAVMRQHQALIYYSLFYGDASCPAALWSCAACRRAPVSFAPLSFVLVALSLCSKQSSQLRDASQRVHQ